MVDYMAEAKAYRLAYIEATRKEEEKKKCRRIKDGRRAVVAEALRDWKRKNNKLKEWGPSIADVLMAKHNGVSIKVLVKETSEADIDASALAIFFSDFEKYCEAWIGNTRYQMLHPIMRMMIVAERVHGAISQPLRWPMTYTLATMVFTCTVKNSCLCSFTDADDRFSEPQTHYMYFPEYLHHRCNTIHLRNPSKDGRLKPALRLGFGYPFPQHVMRAPWSADALVFDDKASQLVSKIVRACGMDPSTTTVNELDNRDPRVVCLKCTYGHRCDGERSVEVRSWRVAVRHAMKVHWGDSRVEWEVICDEDAKRLRMESAAKMSQARALHPQWRCAWCVDQSKEPDDMSIMLIRHHLRQE